MDDRKFKLFRFKKIQEKFGMLFFSPQNHEVTYIPTGTFVCICVLNLLKHYF